MRPAPALLAALRVAPRRYRLPQLPVDAAAAQAAGTETALAFAIEAARRAQQQGAQAPAGVHELFTRNLATLIGKALAPAGGDPAFQALVLRSQHAQVGEHVRLAAQLAADRRAVRAAVNAVAHPHKLRDLADAPLREALSQLHALAAAGAWSALAQAIERLPLAQAFALQAQPALQRLILGSALLDHDAVQRYRALCEQRGPLAGSAAAAAQGRAGARAGGDAEQATVQAFRQLAALLDTHAQPPAGHRVLRTLRTPSGFPGEAGNAKDEWDAAIVHARVAGGHAIVLLAEVKASPAAAASDFWRLHRGLRRLALADAQTAYLFPTADGAMRLAGASLRELQPPGGSLPPHVIYCCCAPIEQQPAVLGAAGKALLLAEPASLAFAQRLARGEAPPHADLTGVWEALAAQPRLRAALHQYETAQAARAAMLHPQDLVSALAQCLAGQAVKPGS